MAKRVRHRFEYLGARLGLALADALPPRALCAFARSLGRLAYALLARRRRIAVDNLLKAGVAHTPREARRLARASFESLALAVVESRIVSRALAAEGEPPFTVDIELPDATAKLVDDPAVGIIAVSGHLGNWEIAPKVFSRRKPITGIARKMDNPLVQSLLERGGLRENDRYEIIDKHEKSPMKIVRAIRNHRILAILTDQHANDERACRIDFFGRPARTYTTPAFIQHLTGAPIVFVSAVRTGTLHFVIRFSEPIYYPLRKESLEADVRAATQDLAARLEAAIREHPEQYLWAHRRWKG